MHASSLHWSHVGHCREYGFGTPFQRSWRFFSRAAAINAPFRALSWLARINSSTIKKLVFGSLIRLSREKAVGWLNVTTTIPLVISDKKGSWALHVGAGQPVDVLEPTDSCCVAPDPRSQR